MKPSFWLVAEIRQFLRSFFQQFNLLQKKLHHVTVWPLILLLGCFQVIPKSHKGPLYSHYTDGDFSAAINDPKFDPSSAVHMEVPSGGVSFHHVMLAHGSSANRSNHKRRLYVYQYCSTDAWPLLGVGSLQFGATGPVDWDLFTSTILRGEATKFPKMEAVPVCIPIPFENTYALEGGDRIKSSHADPE